MIPFLDLKAINAPYEEAFKKAFDQFLLTGFYVRGGQVDAFEKEFATYCGTQYSIGVGNGLDALRLILEGYKQLGKLQIGDEVLVCAHSYIATVLGITQAGLVPVLVDCDDSSFNFDLNALEASLTSRTKVLMPTHLYGQLAPMEALQSFASANNLLMVTDSAQSHGAIDEKGRRSGSLADAAAFSFYPTKNLGAMGDGGAVTTDDGPLAGIIRKLSNYGFEERYVSKYPGINSRLDEVQAAFLRIKLKNLDAENEARRQMAANYLAGINTKRIRLPQWDGTKNHVFHLFVVRVDQRALFRNYLSKEGVQTMVHYPVPPHKQEGLAYKGATQLPKASQLAEEVVSIPLHPRLSDQDIQRIIHLVNQY